MAASDDTMTMSGTENGLGASREFCTEHVHMCWAVHSDYDSGCVIHQLIDYFVVQSRMNACITYCIVIQLGLQLASQWLSWMPACC